MASQILLLLLLFTITVPSLSKPIITSPPENRWYLSTVRDIVAGGGRKTPKHERLYCESWKFTVEANNAGKWKLVPTRCAAYVQEYMTGGHYVSDSEAVAYQSLIFAKSVKLSGNGKDAWVFDVDETLLSNAPFFAARGWGSQPYSDDGWIKWEDSTTLDVLPASLRLYNELKNLGFKIFLITGRYESQRKWTEKNLHLAGYNNREKLILRSPSEESLPATIYKSQKRKEIEDQGYKIHGSSGDQWSDLMGFSLATRSFKLPNPMYYIP